MSSDSGVGSFISSDKGTSPLFYSFSCSLSGYREASRLFSASFCISESFILSISLILPRSSCLVCGVLLSSWHVCYSVNVWLYTAMSNELLLRNIPPEVICTTGLLPFSSRFIIVWLSGTVLESKFAILFCRIFSISCMEFWWLSWSCRLLGEGLSRLSEELSRIIHDGS